MTAPNSSSSPNNPNTTEVHDFINQEERAKNQAYAERYAEVSLKSRPLPENFDPNQHATVGQAIQTIKPEDFLRVHQTPCARDGMLAFIVGGAGVGSLKYVFGGNHDISFYSTSDHAGVRRADWMHDLTDAILQRRYPKPPTGQSTPERRLAFYHTNIASISEGWRRRI